jgi:hypothetical protein
MAAPGGEEVPGWLAKLQRPMVFVPEGATPSPVWTAGPTDVVLVAGTYSKAAPPGLIPDDEYLMRGLRAAGLNPVVKFWTDETVEWASAPLVIIRSVFEMHDSQARYEEFLAFLDMLIVAGCEPRSDLENCRFITHKRYLVALAAAGVAVVPTVIFEKKIHATASAAWEQVASAAWKRGWRDCVWKPCLGSQGDGVERINTLAGGELAGKESAKGSREKQSSRAAAGATCEVGSVAADTSERKHPSGLKRCRASTNPKCETRDVKQRPIEMPSADSDIKKHELVRRTLADRDMMLQPFLPLVSTHGEICLVFAGGELLHAVRKDPQGWSGNHQLVRQTSPTSAQLAVALSALAALPGKKSLFVRVDLLPVGTRAGVPSPSDCSSTGPPPTVESLNWELSEIEAAWPELFLRAAQLELVNKLGQVILAKFLRARALPS